MKKILFASVLALSLLSCTENKSRNGGAVENAVDNAESSVSGSLKSYRKEDMVDQIYFELIKNDKKLKALDDKISKTEEKFNKVISGYDEILSKSRSYYQNANYQAGTITDSLMKKEVIDQIKISSDQYDIKVKNIKALISLANKNQEKTNNLYTAFKIRKTIPEIEKYQKAHPLKTDSLTHFINKQNQLLNELKNLK
ncbi:hypothetical protein [Chryseobacterium populi]|uniref:Lipoprotein n=1 Tax=Chryseobacterium populi TaxID=1144316 RepID=J2JHQ3_9FLAO|nr:hypothetical protein [Chryseobacterium populi]EJL67460.1 hypothetical protein PMI13_04128 [Chryseobacterium populi]